VATIIYDATVSFCERFVDRRSRTVDQMVQAARSGRQNIAEGSRAASTSSQTELRLVSVARASLDELLLDYEDFLRQRGKRLWSKDDPQAQAVREVGRRMASARLSTGPTDQMDAAPYAPWLMHADSAIVANATLCLIHQANYLLDKQIAGLERDFIHDGGYSEQLAAARIHERRRQDRVRQPSSSNRAEGNLPTCPLCGKAMALRTARQSKNAGTHFWGCSGYPECRGTRNSDGSD
jgi:four helix bundle suffix protein